MTALARSILARSKRSPTVHTGREGDLAPTRRPAPLTAARVTRTPDPVPADMRALFPYGVMRCHYCRGQVYRRGSAAAVEDPNSRLTRDHTTPRCDGGRETVPCCHLCNEIKGSDPYEVFVAFMRWPDSRDPATRRAAYRLFRVELLKIGLAAFEEELARLAEARDG